MSARRVQCVVSGRFKKTTLPKSGVYTVLVNHCSVAFTENVGDLGILERTRQARRKVRHFHRVVSLSIESFHLVLIVLSGIRRGEWKALSEDVQSALEAAFSAKPR